MDQPRLTSLPPEVVHYTCLFISKEDIINLSKTSVHMYNVLNDDRVWKRFISEQTTRLGRNLETQQQLLEPHLDLNPDLCKSKLHIILENQLASNWKNGKCSIQTSAEHNIDLVENVLFIKEEYMLVKSGNKMHFWNVQDTPVHHSMTFIPNVERVFVIEDNLVLVLSGRCVVDVRKINTEDKSLLHTYSFSITENEVVYDQVPSLVCEHKEHRSESFDSHKVRDLLVFVPRTKETPSVHIWDVINARKVGEYGSPMWGPTSIHSSQGNTVVFECEDSLWKHYFKFDVLSHEFSTRVYRLQKTNLKVLFYNQYCLQFTFATIRRPRPSLRDALFRGPLHISIPTYPPTWHMLTCKVDNSLLSIELRRRTFEKVNRSCLSDFSIVVVLGKFVVPCLENLYVVTASNLEVESVVPNQLCSAVYPISLSGSFFLQTVEADKYVRVWDHGDSKHILTLEPKGFSFVNTSGFTIYGGEYCNMFYKLRIEDEGLRHLQSKFILFGNKRVTVTHFW